MINIFLPLLVAFGITVLTTPLAIKLAKKYDLVDDPEKRPHPAHIQKRIIPRAGGLSIFAGLIITILIFVPLDKHILGIVLGLILLLVVGILDDKLKKFSPFLRLLLQFLSAAIVVISGIGISFISDPLGGGQLRLDQFVYSIDLLGPHKIIPIADIFAFFWIAWMMNVVNWANGVDGQTPGIIAVAAISIGFLSWNLFNHGDPNQLEIAKLAFILAGTALGFLIFNWYPSKIIPGFAGNTIFGFMIAVLSILSGAKLATALLVLLIPSIDFFYTFFRRILSGKSPFLGDQKHLHHLLLARGWSHPVISLFYILSCVILGLLATNLSTEGKLFIALAVGVIVFGSILWLHLLSASFGRSDRDNG